MAEDARAMHQDAVKSTLFAWQRLRGGTQGAEVSDHVGTICRLLEARKCHFVARDIFFWIGKESVHALEVPHAFNLRYL